MLILFLYRYLLGKDFNVNDSDDYDVRHARRDCVSLFAGYLSDACLIDVRDHDRSCCNDLAIRFTGCNSAQHALRLPLYTLAFFQVFALTKSTALTLIKTGHQVWTLLQRALVYSP